MTQFEQVEEQVQEQVVTCAAHPDTPSNLRCSKCDKAICPPLPGADTGGGHVVPTARSSRSCQFSR